MTNLKIGTFNVHHGLPDTVVANDVARFARTGIHVAGLQEAGGHVDVIGQALPTGWDIIYGDGSMPQDTRANPIIHDTTRLRLYRSGYVKVNDPTDAEDAAGGTSIPEKGLFWGRFHDLLTDGTCWLVNHHAVTGCDAGGVPNENNPIRLGLLAQLMDVLGREVGVRRADNVPVYVVGDFNIDYVGDRQHQDPRFLDSNLESWGLRSSYHRLGVDGLLPTNANRYIDYVAHTVGAATPIDHTVLDGYASDHRPLMVTEYLY